MKAIVREKYGDSEVLKIKELLKPLLGPNEVLVQLKASSVNKADWHMMTGKPFPLRFTTGLSKPKDFRMGADVAGVVEQIGSKVADFKVGDRVFGDLSDAGFGAWSEIVKCPAEALAHLPKEVDFESAAALPLAGITALQGLRDTAQVQSGDTVLINGASGGVGSFAIQIAKILGAKVTAVCGPNKHEQALTLGADDVIDYHQVIFTQMDRQWSVVFDMVGNHSPAAISKALKKHGSFCCGAPLLSVPLVSGWYKWRKAQNMHLFIAKANRADLEVLANWAREGLLRSPIEARYRLEEVPAAMQRFVEGGLKGKLVIDLDSSI